MQSESKTALFQ